MNERTTEDIVRVKRVQQSYYLRVKRYTSGAFFRHKLGTELAKREISSEALDSTNGKT